ncbi:4'-phosphopantetheinyl transferase superfamily protein [Luteolibacter sp. SL250]|uniref:4'-phosphopantetheinyl transferase family protein n=1 Tax=Luteolibacter sp. SL250 TaxID=2995170 RepID=UPI00226F90F9|nr:4'-phosphopantetheinyl transferase superfamily protein [Luteolibacter sp. SL250]WAC19374.1 4'-phosphopantetheinyl transferase superfamily protein [Luteolibacter sp. SL250]
MLHPGEIRADIRSLNEAEQTRAASFRFENDARHWTACRSGLRAILGRVLSLPPAEVPLVTGPGGKPCLAPPFADTHFNLSHCRDLALVAVATFPVGIDVEPESRARDLLGCEESFCHPQEIAGLPEDESMRAVGLLEIWNAKEAVLKAHGTGLLTPPQSFAVSFADPSARTYFHPELSTQHIQRLIHPALRHHSAFISSQHPYPGIIYHMEIEAP